MRRRESGKRIGIERGGCAVRRGGSDCIHLTGINRGYTIRGGRILLTACDRDRVGVVEVLPKADTGMLLD